MNQEFPDVQVGFQRDKGTRDEIANIYWIKEKTRKFQKNKSTSASLLESLWLCGSQQTGKFLNRWEYQTTLPFSWEPCMRVKKQQLELEMEHWTGLKLGKENNKAVYCHLAYLTSMQNTSCKMSGWMNHKLASRLMEKYQPSQIYGWHHSNGRKWRGTKDTTVMAESEEELKILLMKVKEDSEKAKLKVNIQKIRSWNSVPSLHGK